MNIDSLYSIKMKILFFVILFSISPVNYSQKLPLNLNEAIEISLNNNKMIKQYDEKLIQKELQNFSAWGNFLPTINLGIGYNHLDSPLSIDLNPIRNVIISLQAANQGELNNLINLISTGTQLTDEQKNSIINSSRNKLNNIIPKFRENFKEKEYLSGGFNVVQPVFMGGKLLAAKKAASIELNSAQLEKVKVQNEITAEVINIYIQTLVLGKLVKTRANFYSGILLHRNRAKQLFDQGIISYNQYLRAVVAADEAEQKLIEEKNNFELSLLALKYKLNLTDSTDLLLTDSLQLNPLNFEIENNTLKNQPILKLIEDKENLVAQSYNANRAEFLPSIYAFGKYDIFPQYLSALEPRFVLGLQLNFNLFKGFKDYSKLSELKSIEDELKHLKDETILNLELGKEKALMNIQNAKSRFEKLNSSILSAEENLHQNEIRFENGLSNSVDVIDARLFLEKIELDKIIAVHDYYKALNQFALITGEHKLFMDTFYNRRSE